MSFNFQPYKEAGGWGLYAISISPNYKMNIMKGFEKGENIAQYTHVQLSYDVANMRIGFYFNNDGNKLGNYKVTRPADRVNNLTLIHCPRRLIKKFGLTIDDVTGRYTPRKKGRYFYIELGGGKI